MNHGDPIATEPRIEVADEIVSFFDLLAYFDALDAKKEKESLRADSESQEVIKGSCMVSGEPFIGSCDLPKCTA
jgi:hypothetical protein